jgi:fructose-1,6-bisphosphatase/inositol monophosphatase family enzyme
VLVALEEADESLVGVAHFPLLAETYSAVRGRGAYRNAERLQASAVLRVEECVFSPNGLHLAHAVPHLPKLMDWAQRSWCVRSYGGALDACMLAAGKVDLWFEPKVEPWDLAALKLIVEEAGGVFFALDGSRRIDRGTAVAVAPGLAAAARQAFLTAPSGQPDIPPDGVPS